MNASETNSLLLKPINIILKKTNRENTLSIIYGLKRVDALEKNKPLLDEIFPTSNPSLKFVRFVMSIMQKEKRLYNY
jgi:hypothetical protein